MAQRRVHLRTTARQRPVPGGDSALAAAFEAIRVEFDVPRDFPAAAQAEAEAAAAGAVWPDRDETAVDFFTIDPPGSTDLDQAMCLERDGAGYRVRYAIADVPAFVRLGGAVDDEARRRGQTIYLPDERSPLHPSVLCEDAASLLPGRVRPAFVWDVRLDSAGEATSATVYRARVRSTRRLDYDTVQRDLDAGTAPEPVALLEEIGTKRIDLQRARGGASLPMPEQDVSIDSQGRYRIAFRPTVLAQEYNAQISLLTGMVAASLMIEHGVGILRTMPAPDVRALVRFRRQAQALGVAWAPEVAYGEFLLGLDRADPRHLALVHDAASLFRGAGYTPFDGDVPDMTVHAAVAAPYAHVTAPLRRLVDRFGLLVCAALSAGEQVPAQVRDVLPLLPDLMSSGGRRASAVDRACADAVEAALLADRVGETFDAVVVDKHGKGACVIQILEPAVLAPCTAALAAGTRAQVTLDDVDVLARSVRFSPA